MGRQNNNTNKQLMVRSISILHDEPITITIITITITVCFLLSSSITEVCQTLRFSELDAWCSDEADSDAFRRRYCLPTPHHVSSGYSTRPARFSNASVLRRSLSSPCSSHCSMAVSVPTARAARKGESYNIIAYHIT